MAEDIIQVKLEPIESISFQVPIESRGPHVLVDLESKLEDCIEIRRSTVGGRGLFVRQDIIGGYLPRGYNLGRYCPKTKFSKPIEPGQGACSFYGFNIKIAGRTTEVYVDGMDEHGRIDGELPMCNHSFNPNVQVCKDGTFIVLVNIKAGDELFINYGMAYWTRALPELRDMPQACIKALLTPNLSPNADVFDHWKKLETLDKKLKLLNTNRDKMWQGLAERTREVIDFRKNQTEEQREYQRVKNAKFREKLPSPLPVDELNRLQKIADVKKQTKFNRRFNHRRRNTKAMEALKAYRLALKKAQEKSHVTESIVSRVNTQLVCEPIPTNVLLSDVQIEPTNVLLSYVQIENKKEELHKLLRPSELQLHLEKKGLEKKCLKKRHISVVKNDLTDKVLEPKKKKPMKENRERKIGKEKCSCVLVDNLEVWNRTLALPFKNFLETLSVSTSTRSNYFRNVLHCFRHGYSVDKLRDALGLRDKMDLTCSNDRIAYGGFRLAGLRAFAKFCAEKKT